MMRELKTLQREYDVDESEVNCEEIVRTVADLKDEVKEVKQRIVKEDNERQLYSLDTPKVSKVNLPIFGGEDHEDFNKFIPGNIFPDGCGATTSPESTVRLCQKVKVIY